MSVGNSAFEITLFVSKRIYFFGPQKNIKSNITLQLNEALIMVASTALVVAIWLNVLWHVFQKCMLTLEDKKGTYACMCAYEG